MLGGLTSEISVFQVELEDGTVGIPHAVADARLTPALGGVEVVQGLGVSVDGVAYEMEVLHLRQLLQLQILLARLCVVAGVNPWG